MFAISQQSLVKSSDYRIVLHGTHRGHEQHHSYVGPAAPDAAFATHRSAVPVHRRHTDQCGDLFLVERAP